jgi:hypothetical protein
LGTAAIGNVLDLGLDGCHSVGVWIPHLKEIADTINSKAIFTCLIPELGIGELVFFSCRTNNEIRGLAVIFLDFGKSTGVFDIGQPFTIPSDPCRQSYGFLSDNMM